MMKNVLILKEDHFGELRNFQAARKINDSINDKLNIYMEKRIGRMTISGSRLLSHLPIKLLNRINREMDSLYGRHVNRFLVDANYHYSPEFIEAYLDLLSTLDQQHHGIASDYFVTLGRWDIGDTRSLDLMVHFSGEYLAATGTDILPCTTENDQHVFARLREEPRLIDPIMNLANHTDEITLELLDKLATVAPALINGAL